MRLIKSGLANGVLAKSTVKATSSERLRIRAPSNQDARTGRSLARKKRLARSCAAIIFRILRWPSYQLKSSLALYLDPFPELSQGAGKERAARMYPQPRANYMLKLDESKE